METPTKEEIEITQKTLQYLIESFKYKYLSKRYDSKSSRWYGEYSRRLRDVKKEVINRILNNDLDYIRTDKDINKWFFGIEKWTRAKRWF